MQTQPQQHELGFDAPLAPESPRKKKSTKSVEPPLTHREREKRKRLLRRLAKGMRNPPKKYTEGLHEFVQRMEQAGLPLPEQRVLAMRWRRAGVTGEIKRRVHEKPGNDVFTDLTTEGASRLQTKLFEDSISRLTVGDLTDDDQAETWAWIDREPDVTNPLDFAACLEAFLARSDKDPIWVREGIERLRPEWLKDHRIKPKAYATYWVAVVLG